MQEKAAETLRYVHFQVKYEIEEVVFLSKLWVLFVFNIEKRVRGMVSHPTDLWFHPQHGGSPLFY